MGARKEMRKAGLFFFNEKKEKEKKKKKKRKRQKESQTTIVEFWHQPRLEIWVPGP